MSNALFYEDCALNYTQSPLDDSITSGCKGWSSAKIQGEMDTAHCDINNTIQSCYDATLSCINSSVSSINTDLSNKYAVCCNPTVKIGLASCVGNYGIAIGCGAGSYSSNYQYTIAVGTNARALGNYGVAIGYQTGASFTGSNNLAIGTYAMYGASGATGCNNTAIGYNALRNIRGTANNDNTAIGSSALQAMTTGLYNTAIGSRALCGLTTGCENFGLGIDTGWAITTGCNNTLIGNNTGMGITGDSSENTLIGKNIACASSGALCEATIIGSKASPNVTGIGNTAIGYCALPALTTGIGNTVVGRYAGNPLTIGCYNTLLGYEARTYLNATSYGVAIGYNATAGAESIAVGPNSCTIGGAGQAIGSSAYAHNYATAIGLQACAGISSVSIGPNANCVLLGNECYAVSVGNGTYAYTYATALGNGAKAGCYSIATGADSCATANFGIAIGCNARTICCPQGIAIGYQSCTNGTASVAIGNSSKVYGDYNIALGYNSCVVCGNNNIAIGNIRTSASASYSIGIGYCTPDLSPHASGNCSTSIALSNKISGFTYISGVNEPGCQIGKCFTEKLQLANIPRVYLGLDGEGGQFYPFIPAMGLVSYSYCCNPGCCPACLVNGIVFTCSGDNTDNYCVTGMYLVYRKSASAFLTVSSNLLCRNSSSMTYQLLTLLGINC